MDTSRLKAKLIISTPWECLCVDLIGLYTIKGKDGLQIDFMALTMIDPASSWFKIVELQETMDYERQWQGAAKIGRDL